MAYQSVLVHPSAARTANGNGQAILDSDRGDTLSLLVAVTAASGTTPTLDLAVEWSHDGSTWAPAETPDAFTQITATGSKVKTFTVKAPHYRVVWVIGGTTPSFTFSVRGMMTN